MEDYIARVARAAAERKGEPVFNGSVDHARVIVGAMFKHARKTVDIYSGTLNPRVYSPDDVLDEAQAFVATNDHKVRILLDYAEPSLKENHPFFQRLSTYGNIDLKVLPTNISQKIKFHLLVADDDCYRFEDDKSQVAAIAAWGDAKGGKHLKSMFESLWSMGNALTA